MLLRPRQETMVSNIVGALSEHDNTLAVAPTGAGKTVMLSAALGRMFKKGSLNKACVLQHRDELTTQNSATFLRMNPSLTASFFNAEAKSWRGDVGFAMVQTLTRPENRETMPVLDALIIDEAHHACADSYLRIIEQARKNNPNCKLLGVTATPMRGDKKGLRAVFDNVCDQITVGELIRSGHLVKPRTFVMNVGVQDELRQVKKTASDYDMGEVAEIMDKRPINQAVVQHWKEKAGGRQTVVFCSTLAHAAHVAALASGDKSVCLSAANDWLNLHETEDSAHKTRRWLYEQATPKQLQYLPPQYQHDYSLTRYEASALMTLKFNQRAIKQAVGAL